MNQNNTEVFELDNQYSTTRCVKHTPPDIVNNPEDKIRSVLFLPENTERKAVGGLRTHGYFKQTQTNKPLISVITVVFNGAEYLEQTINSVIRQTYDNVEYIIIDGGSSDNTVDIVKKYEQQIDYWVSETDEGIYDAMNKGIGLATGKWINFMNAGDWFYSNKTIGSIYAHQSDKDFIYGNYETRYPTFNKSCKALPLTCIWKGMVFSHQSAFVKRKLHINYPFDVSSFVISADYDFIYNSYKNESDSFLYLNQCLSSINIIGYSSGNVIPLLNENYKIAKKHNNSYALHFYYLYKFLTAIPKEFIKNNLPIKYVDSLRKIF